MIGTDRSPLCIVADDGRHEPTVGGQRDALQGDEVAKEGVLVGNQPDLGSLVDDLVVSAAA